jgi:hypothetical protein
MIFMIFCVTIGSLARPWWALRSPRMQALSLRCTAHAVVTLQRRPLAARSGFHPGGRAACPYSIFPQKAYYPPHV